MLAKHKASQQPRHLQRATEYAWSARWWSLLTVAAQGTFAASLVELDSTKIRSMVDFEPSDTEVLAGARYDLGPVASRLPLRG